MKKLLCLVVVVLFMVACSNDSTDSAPQSPAPRSTPTENAAQTDNVQEGTDQVAAIGQEPNDGAGQSFAQGSSIYQQNCRSCHDSGLMGAPQIGDDRYSADIDELVDNSIKGIGRMPARGGNSNLSDEDVRAAVEYMVEESK